MSSIRDPFRQRGLRRAVIEALEVRSLLSASLATAQLESTFPVRTESLAGNEHLEPHHHSPHAHHHHNVRHHHHHAGSGNHHQEQLILSELSGDGAPFTPLILTGKFNPAANPIVRITDGKGYQVDLTPQSVSAGQITVLFPPYVAPVTGEFASGSVSVQVIQGAGGPVSNTRETIVQDLPTTTAAPGTVTLAYLQAEREVAGDLRARSAGASFFTEEFAAQADAYIGSLDEQIATTQSLISGAVDSVPVGTVGDTPVFLTVSELGSMDRLLLGQFDAEAASLPGAGGSTVRSLADAARSNEAELSAKAKDYLRDVAITENGLKRVDRIVGYGGLVLKAVGAGAVAKGVSFGYAGVKVLSGAATILWGSMLENEGVPGAEAGIERGKAILAGGLSDATFALVKLPYFLTIAKGVLKPTQLGGEDADSINITLEDDTGGEVGNDNITFVVSRSAGPDDFAITVPINYGGLATAGDDYTGAFPSVTLLPGQDVTVTLKPVADAKIEGDEALTIQLVEGLNYTVVTPKVSATILDTVVSVEAVNDAKEGSTLGVFRVSRTGSTEGALPVAFSLSGTATPDVDYSSSAAGSVTIPAGAASVDVQINANVDDPDPGEQVTLTVATSTQYAIQTDVASLVINEQNDENPFIGVWSGQYTFQQATQQSLPGGGPLGVVSGTGTMTLSIAPAGPGLLKSTVTLSKVQGSNLTNSIGSVTLTVVITAVAPNNANAGTFMRVGPVQGNFDIPGIMTISGTEVGTTTIQSPANLDFIANLVDGDLQGQFSSTIFP